MKTNRRLLKKFGVTVAVFLTLVVLVGLCQTGPAVAESLLDAAPAGSGPGNVYWVSYSPSGDWNPGQGLYPSVEDIQADMEKLYCKGFRGIITYGSDNNLTWVPYLAKAAGFRFVIMGIWNPKSQEELANAIGSQAYVDAYCVGNEGLTYPYGGDLDYTCPELGDAIAYLKSATNKPVTTSEPSEAYLGEYQWVDPDCLMNFGDWLFPNAHPYWAGITEPTAAVAWTETRYEDILAARATYGVGNKYVFFKEVGLPTEGDANLSEQNQAEYYIRLLRTPVQFSFFEAFDQTWKDGHPVEPHWGLFSSDRTPKLLMQVVGPHCP